MTPLQVMPPLLCPSGTEASSPAKKMHERPHHTKTNQDVVRSHTPPFSFVFGTPTASLSNDSAERPTDLNRKTQSHRPLCPLLKFPVVQAVTKARSSPQEVERGGGQIRDGVLPPHPQSIARSLPPPLLPLTFSPYLASSSCAAPLAPNLIQQTTLPFARLLDTQAAATIFMCVSASIGNGCFPGARPLLSYGRRGAPK